MTISFVRPFAPLFVLFCLLATGLALATSPPVGLPGKEALGPAPGRVPNFDPHTARVNAFAPPLVDADGSDVARRSGVQSMAADPALSSEHLVAQVLQRNQGIVAMQAAADAAEAQVESAGALDDPMLSYIAAPNTFGGPRQALDQNVQFSQKLPWPGTLQLRTRAARAEVASAEQQVADLRLRLAARARALYGQWYYVHRALAINAENSDLLVRLQGVAETAYSSGLAPQQDVLQAQVERVRLESQALELERARRTVQAGINTLLNQPPDTELPAPTDLSESTTLPAYAHLREAALARYPQLLGLDAQLSARRDRLDLAHKNNLPQFNVMAGYNGLMDMPAQRLTVGLAINIPFGANHRGEIGAANARVHEAEANLADARSQLLGDLDQSWAAARQASGTIELYSTRLLGLSKLNLQAAEADYSSGAGDFLKLITAEQQYLAFKLELARARADFFTQWASLEYQTGGALSPVTAQEARP